MREIIDYYEAMEVKYGLRVASPELPRSPFTIRPAGSPVQRLAPAVTHEPLQELLPLDDEDEDDDEPDDIDDIAADFDVVLSRAE